MIVDDDPDILEIVSILLQSKGYEVITYSYPNDIVQKVKDIVPSVVLLDIQLGEFDGRDSCKQIKEDKECLHIPVILFSANGRYKFGSEIYLNDDFIEKPFDVNSFLNKINHYSEIGSL